MSKPKLEDLLDQHKAAEKAFRQRMAHTGPGESLGVNPAKEIYQQIQKYYPDFYPKLKEININAAITLLKSEGYKILKPEVHTEFKEV